MNALRHQHGMTLVELMIAAALSLVVMGFITNIMISGSRTAMQSEGLAQAQENGRFILSWLQTQVRKAGYPGIEGTISERIQPFATPCAAGAAIPPANGGDCSFESASSANGGDRLAIQRVYNTASTNNTDLQDCTGVLINSTGTAVPDGATITDVYWVDNQDDSLWCATYYQNAVIINRQAIANGVQALQVLYGSQAGVDVQYRSQVTRYTSLQEALNLGSWSDIRAVRLGILTRSSSESAAERLERRYIVLDSAPSTFTDRIARHIQTTTIYLQNK